MLKTTRILALTVSLAAVATLAAPVGAHNEGLPSIPLSIENMELVYNRPQVGGNNLAFFERKEEDGTIKRYVVASTKVNGFDIMDITDPGHVTVAGSYTLGGEAGDAASNSSAGANYHPWVDVNPRKNIVVLTIENPGGALRHGSTTGAAFVDIADIANPTLLGKTDGLGGPHTVRMVGDHCAYTSLDTYIIDYSDPTDPQAVRPPPQLQVHEVWEDPNIPGRAYVGTVTTGKWAIWDTSDCMNPQIVTEVRDTALDTAHEVYPAPDSSYVGVADFTRDGQTQTECPGGGIHFYDISGRYMPGASAANPVKMGVYHAPFDGTLSTASGPNHASCTMHSWAMNPEREIALGGLYTGGTYVLDPTVTADDDEHESSTHGNTVGRIRDALDFVNATQFLPFDYEDPEANRYVVVTGWERGVDVYEYTGPMPKKMARLTVDATAAGGAVTGTLERYAVLTHTGWVNKPLAGQTVTVSTGGTSVDVVTAEDGSFSADLGAGSGSEVTATWAGDDVFRGETTTQTIG